jgi:hypothetical protein
VAAGVAGKTFPNYMPLWSVAVDTAIMKDHDDIWNPQIVKLISILFTDAYVQTERLHASGENLTFGTLANRSKPAETKASSRYHPLRSHH